MEMKTLVNKQYADGTKAIVMVSLVPMQRAVVILRECVQKYSRPTRHDSFSSVTVNGSTFANLEDAIAAQKNKQVRSMIAAATGVACVPVDVRKTYVC
tara:strand:+ start:938 stop:1231 length:294 start_codon:yes stop_codon:yes gene_type:complete